MHEFRNAAARAARTQSRHTVHQEAKRKRRLECCSRHVTYHVTARDQQFALLASVCRAATAAARVANLCCAAACADAVRPHVTAARMCRHVGP